MKRTLFFAVIIALLFSEQANAQLPGVPSVPKVMFGIKAGGDFSGLSGSTWEQSYNGGFVGGLFLGFHGKRFGVQAEGLLTTSKFDVNASQTSASVATLNFAVPVMIEYKIIPRLWIQLGPQFSDVLSESFHNTLGPTNNVFTPTDFDGVVGLQAILPLHLVAGARYIFGVTNVNNDNPQNGPGQPTWKDKAFQLSVGFRFL